ncbi:hypothetical protein OROMI_018534 [Orobanche minor]
MFQLLLARLMHLALNLSTSCRATAQEVYKDNHHVSMGAEKWLDIEVWSSMRECFENLRARGYRIATAYLGTDTVSVYDVDWSCPMAIVVGNELRGISEEALELSDVHCSIPMRCMVDSFNVLVAAGLPMHHVVCDRTLRTRLSWGSWGSNAERAPPVSPMNFQRGS